MGSFKIAVTPDKIRNSHTQVSQSGCSLAHNFHSYSGTSICQRVEGLAKRVRHNEVP